MKLSEFKNHLETVTTVNLVQPDGQIVPPHFHITEVGLVTKHFIDCGGTVRLEKAANFQVWVADDEDHRLEPQKLLRIIGLSAKLFENDDIDVEVEYQTDTVGKFGLDFNGLNFVLTAKQTACLAQEECGVPQAIETELEKACCSPGGGCC
ncbi:MAG TPA: DUF6428 family protein [Catalimonadaceae bacterium]|jgi:hypothetical protein|nr:DUF6428 family protein [Catalimonadaceae bacterium]